MNTGIQYESLKFKAELLKTVGLLLATPAGTVLMETFKHGPRYEWTYLIQVFMGIFSYVICQLMFGASCAIMDDRDWRIQRETRRDLR